MNFAEHKDITICPGANRPLRSSYLPTSKVHGLVGEDQQAVANASDVADALLHVRSV